MGSAPAVSDAELDGRRRRLNLPVEAADHGLDDRLTLRETRKRAKKSRTK